MKRVLTKMKLNLPYHYWVLLAILVFAFGVRLINLKIPDTYYFDEVYHAVTAKAYAVNNPAGYEWWHEAPEPGTAYEWLHPPVAKLFMAVGWKYLGQTPWAWRFPGVIFGVLTVWITYWVAATVSKKVTIGLAAAGLASLDGLLLAQSRIGMNDIYVTFFMMAALGAYFKSRQTGALTINGWLWIAGVVAGIALSTKWSGVFSIGIIGTLELILWFQAGKAWLRRLPWLVLIFGVIPIGIYGLSYGQFWLQGHTISQFVELYQQIWWYQTHLEATHAYQSKAWEWPLLIRPVWLWVNYLPNGMIAKYYNLANPALAWFGLVALLSLLPAVRLKEKKTRTVPALLMILVSYAWSWMPWLLSPRIMFFYHYTPAIPWLCIGLAYQLESLWHQPKGKWIAGLIGVTVLGSFIWLSPMWLGFPLPASWWKWIYWLPSWE